MAALPPDHAKQALVRSLSAARAEASRLGLGLAASLIGMTILSIGPPGSDGEGDPVPRNDNQSLPDQG